MVLQNEGTLTWEEMVRIEPELEELLTDVILYENEEPEESLCQVWAYRFKPRLLWFVGYFARRKELRSSECYELAYATLYDRLCESVEVI